MSEHAISYRLPRSSITIKNRKVVIVSSNGFILELDIPKMNIRLFYKFLKNFKTGYSFLKLYLQNEDTIIFDFTYRQISRNNRESGIRRFKLNDEAIKSWKEIFGILYKEFYTDVPDEFLEFCPGQE